jgi:hypothetical protein
MTEEKIYGKHEQFCWNWKNERTDETVEPEMPVKSPGIYRGTDRVGRREVSPATLAALSAIFRDQKKSVGSVGGIAKYLMIHWMKIIGFLNVNRETEEQDVLGITHQIDTMECASGILLCFNKEPRHLPVPAVSSENHSVKALTVRCFRFYSIKKLYTEIGLARPGNSAAPT